jgi:hypothetical protein
MGVMDTTEIQPSPADAPHTGVDRRTLIKRAAIAGAVAWTAPVIIDSVASPAGALSCANTCFRIQYQENSTCSGMPSVTFGDNFTGCPTPTTFDASGTGVACPTITTFGSGLTLASKCLSASATGNNCNSGNVLTFTLSQAAGCFVGGTCNAPRRILKARARLGNSTCITTPAANGVISADGTTVTFTKTSATSWSQFQLLIGCACSG